MDGDMVPAGSRDAGLLMVLSRPTLALEEAYHRWYDEEHIPARTRLPGWLTARRYVSNDGTGTYLAYYDLEDIGLLSVPDYVSLRENRSTLERTILESADFVDRRIYRSRPSQTPDLDLPTKESPGPPLTESGDISKVDAWAPPIGFSGNLQICGPVLLCVWWEPYPGTEDEFNAWYEEEHLPMLATVPGWLRSRRFDLVEGNGQRYLAMHDLAGTEVFADARYREAISTRRRDAVVAQRSSHERGVFQLLRRLDPEPM